MAFSIREFAKYLLPSKLMTIDRHLLPKLWFHQNHRINISPISLYRSLHLSCNSYAIVDRRGFLATKESFIKKALKKFKYFVVDRSRLKAGSYFLYESVADTVDYPKFFKEMSFPDTFNSWFLITELHVWMLMVKSMEFGERGRKISYFIVEAMWLDVSEKSKKLGVEHMAMARVQVQQLGDHFQAALLAYDEGLLTDDKVLASALWRRFLSKDCKEPQRVEKLVKYVWQQVHNFDKISEDDFHTGRIKWIPIDTTIM